MHKAERITFIEQLLDQLYPAPQVPLDHTDAYSLLVATILSAQCTDERVNKITPGLFQKFPGVDAMALASIDDVKDSIKSCGLANSKSKALVDMSRILIDLHAGQVPADFPALEKLPGVGHKTASVVMAQAFDVPAFPVDTHIHRLAKRWKLSTGKSVEQTERDLKKSFSRAEWNKRHLQIIFFGRQYCPARGHVIAECPICSKI